MIPTTTGTTIATTFSFLEQPFVETSNKTVSELGEPTFLKVTVRQLLDGVSMETPNADRSVALTQPD